jgi:hypothetical protein
MELALPAVVNERIVLDLLKFEERDGKRSWRHIAAELGIALGLVSAYAKRRVNKKGAVEINVAPGRGYAYYWRRKVSGKNPDGRWPILRHFRSLIERVAARTPSRRRKKLASFGWCWLESPIWRKWPFSGQLRRPLRSSRSLTRPAATRGSSALILLDVLGSKVRVCLDADMVAVA